MGVLKGKIPYADSAGELPQLALIWLGNAAGACAMGMAVRLSLPEIADKAATLSSMKLTEELRCIPLAFFCNILIFFAVEGWKKCAGTEKYVVPALCVAVFVISGYEHCVADIFYFVCGGARGFRAFFFILCCTAGNALGGQFACRMSAMSWERN